MGVVGVLEARRNGGAEQRPSGRPIDAAPHRGSASWALDDEEIGALRELVNGACDVPAGTELLQQGERGKCAYIVLDGWAYRYKDLENGRRQVVSFQFPGDFMGLRSILLSQSLLADALGMSVVHLNRALRKLREVRLVEVRNSKLRVLDIDGLEALVNFDSDYLA